LPKLVLINAPADVLGKAEIVTGILVAWLKVQEVNATAIDLWLRVRHL
jgi:hypothetical protein